MKFIVYVLGALAALWLIVTLFKLTVFLIHYGLILAAIAVVGYVVYTLLNKKSENPQTKS